MKTSPPPVGLFQPLMSHSIFEDKSPSSSSSTVFYVVCRKWNTQCVLLEFNPVFFFLNVASLISLTHATCLSWWGWWFHILMQQTSHQDLVYFQELACMKSLVVLFTALTRHEARRVSKHRMIVANGFCHMPLVTVLWRKRLSHVERRPPRCLVVSLSSDMTKCLSSVVSLTDKRYKHCKHCGISAMFVDTLMILRQPLLFYF